MKNKREFIEYFCSKFCPFKNEEFIEDNRCPDCLEKLDDLYEKYVNQIMANLKPINE